MSATATAAASAAASTSAADELVLPLILHMLACNWVLYVVIWIGAAGFAIILPTIWPFLQEVQCCAVSVCSAVQ